MACERGAVQIVQILLENGANPNLTGEDARWLSCLKRIIIGLTALAVLKRCIKIVKYLDYCMVV